MGQVFQGPLGPLASLFEEIPRETQLYRQAGRIATLYIPMNRIANENSTADPAYSLEEPTETVQLPSDFKWWELTLGIIVPPLFPIVQQNANERTYLNYMEEIEAEIRKLLATGPIHQFILRVFRDDDVYRRRREIDQALRKGHTAPPTVNITHGAYDITFGGDHKRLHREKRSAFLPVITELAVSAVSSFVENVVSNLISVVIEVISPSSNTNRLKRLESAMDEFDQDFMITKKMDRGILENIDKLSNIVRETVKRLDKHVKSFPDYAWLSSLIVSRITHSGLDLQRITDEAREGRIATAPFSCLTGLTTHREIPVEDTRFISVTKINNHTLNFRFAARFTRYRSIQSLRLRSLGQLGRSTEVLRPLEIQRSQLPHYSREPVRLRVQN